MTNHGSFKFSFFKFFIVLVVAAACCFVVACRSSSKVDVSEVNKHEESVDVSVFRDSSAFVAQSSGSEIAREESESREDGVVVVCRDSAGRPVRIMWSRSKAENASQKKETIQTENAVCSSGATELSAAVSSSEVKSSHEVNVKKYGSRIECFIGSSIMLAAIAYVVFVVVKDYLLPWFRLRK